MKEIDTKELENQISASKDMESANSISNIIPELTVSQYLNKLLKTHELESKDVIKAANLERTYGYKIFAGDKNPGRPKLLAIAVAMELSHEEVQRLLYYAKEKKLYVKDSWDRVIWYGLEKHITVSDVNTILHDLELAPLLE